MKVIGIVFSAREKGNCFCYVEYCLALLKKKGIDIELVNAFNYNITPCSHCMYECFSKSAGCSIKDDMPKIYKKLETADLLLFGIPTYGGHVSGLYRAFSERAQIWTEEEYEKFMNKLKGFIIIGNLSAGGDMALHEVLFDFWNIKPFPEAILLSAREYGRNSIEGNLIELPEVKEKLKRFSSLLLKRLEE